MKRGCVVKIKWGDAFIDTDDFSTETATKTEPVVRTTVGYYVAKNQHGYVLATDEYDEKGGGYSARMMIPKGMIYTVTEMVEK